MTFAFGFDVVTYLAFYGAAVALILTSGPDTMYVLTCGLDGRGPGVRSTLGTVMNVLFHTLLAMVGTTALFRTVPETAAALKYVGAAYLGYLGVTSLRNDEFDPLAETDAGASFRRDVLVSALNPKVALFFLTFPLGFVGQDAGTGVRMAGLGVTYAALTALYLSVAVLGANRLGLRLVETWVANALNYVGAGTMLLLGVVLVSERA